MTEEKRMLTAEEHNALLQIALLKQDVTLIRSDLSEIRREIKNGAWSKLGYTVLGSVLSSIAIKLVLIAGAHQ